MVAGRLSFALALLAAWTLAPCLPGRAFGQTPQNGGTASPLCQLGCGGSGGPSPVTVTPAVQNASVRDDGALDSVWFDVKNVGTVNYDTYALDVACVSITCVLIPNPHGPLTLYPGSSQREFVKFYHPLSPTSGSISLTATDTYVGDLQATGTTTINGSGSAAPLVSLAPNGSGFQFTTEGAVTYQRGTPALMTLGTPHAVTLTYSSARARPTAIITMDVTNPQSPYPSAYEVQVQSSNGVYLKLPDSLTAVYYRAGTTGTTRLVAPIDAVANGLLPGSLPVTVLVTSIYLHGQVTTSVGTRILVPFQPDTSLGRGVTLAGVPHLYAGTTLGDNGLTLVEPDGSAEYFARTCTPACGPITSPPGESATLVYVAASNVYQLIARDSSSVVEFTGDGRFSRTYAPAGVVNLTAVWSGNGQLLTSLNDTTGVLFTLSYTSNKLTQITDRAGRVTRVTINAGDQLVAVQTPDTLADTLTYDGRNRLIQVKNPAGGLTSYTYSPLGQAWTTAGPSDTTYAGTVLRPTDSLRTAAFVVWHDSASGTSGNPKPNVGPDTLMASAWDALGAVTRTAEDRFGLPLEIVDALGQVTTITRDTLGQVLRSVSPVGHVTINTYGYSGVGPYGRNSTCDSTNVGVTCHLFNYDAHHRLVTDSGSSQRFDYTYHTGTDGGPWGTLFRVYVGDHAWEQGGTVQAAHYRDGFGRDTLAVGYGQDSSRFVYASVASGGNLDSTFDAKHHRTKFRHNAYGLDSITTFADGTADSARYDLLGRVVAAMDALGHRTQYSYGRLGLQRIVTPNNDTYVFDVNAWGLTKRVHDLGDTTKVDVLAYDADGRLRTTTTRAGETISLTYDVLGRDSLRVTSDGDTAVFHYGLLSGHGGWTSTWHRFKGVTVSDSVATDIGGRPTVATQTLPSGATYTLTYSYDWYGRLVGRSSPSGGPATAFYYDPWLSLLDSAHVLGVRQQIGYDAQLLPDSLTYDGRWSHRQVYDSLGEIVQDTFSLSALNQDFAARWTYDSLGRLTRVDPASGSTAQPKKLAYDSIGRFDYECLVVPNQQQYCSQTWSFAYDPAGNETDLGRAIVAGNRLAGLTYDADGRVTVDGGDTVRWNALGQLVLVQRGTAQHPFRDSLSYDATGRRVMKVVDDSGRVTRTYYVYDGGRPILDVDAVTGWTAEYAWNGDGTLFGIRTPSWTGIAISSPTNGTLLGLVDTAGAVLHFYDPFRDPWDQEYLGADVRFGMGGQEFDAELGFYHLGARYYDPTIHRFLSEDPAGTAGGLNLYVYAGDDPINARDPSGLSMEPSNVGAHGVPDNQQRWARYDPLVIDWYDGGSAVAEAWANSMITPFDLWTRYEQGSNYEHYTDKLRVLRSYFASHGMAQAAADARAIGEEQWNLAMRAVASFSSIAFAWVNMTELILEGRSPDHAFALDHNGMFTGPTGNDYVFGRWENTTDRGAFIDFISPKTFDHQSTGCVGGVLIHEMYHYLTGDSDEPHVRWEIGRGLHIDSSLGCRWE